MGRWLIFFGLLLTLVLPGGAEEKPTIKGNLETRVFTAGDARVETRLELKIDAPLGQGWRLHLQPWLDLDLARWGQIVPEFQVRRRTAARVVEGYVEWSDGPWEVRLGQQHIELGQIDKISPLDVWRPRDLRDVLVDEPVGMPAASVTYNPGEEGTRVRALVSPNPLASFLPTPGSDWWSGPRLPVVHGQPKGVTVGVDVEHKFGDLAVNFLALDHPDPIPAYRPIDFGLEEVYVRERVLGGRLTAPVGDWVATVEAVQHWVDAPKLPYLAVVGQLERIWQLDANQTLTLDLGYADRTGGSAPVLDLNFPFRRAPFVNVNYTALDEAGLDTTFQLRAIGSELSGWYLNPEISRQLDANQRLSLGGCLLMGKPETFLGGYASNSRLELKWQLKF